MFLPSTESQVLAFTNDQKNIISINSFTFNFQRQREYLVGVHQMKPRCIKSLNNTIDSKIKFIKCFFLPFPFSYLCNVVSHWLAVPQLGFNLIFATSSSSSMSKSSISHMSSSGIFKFKARLWRTQQATDILNIEWL